MPPGNPPPYDPQGQQPSYPPPPPPGQRAHYPPPPPQPYSQQPPGYYGQPPAKKSRKTLYLVLGIVAGLIVLLVGAGVVVYLTVGRGIVTATDVEVGDCLREIPSTTEVLTVSTISCEEEHAGEVFAVLTMPDGDFPGPAVVERFADKCSPELANYSPEAMTDDEVQLYVLYPTAETWAQGDRAVTCVATLDPPRAGTLKG